MSDRETLEQLKAMTAVERLQVALKADEIVVMDFGSTENWDCQGDVEEVLAAESAHAATELEALERGDKFKAEVERLKAEMATKVGMAADEIERLKAELSKMYQNHPEAACYAANPTQRARIDAALAEAEDVNTPDDYRKIERIVKALKGEKP